ncbi:MAG TPA: aminodeoxychorismate/anthranilate synthase component II [Flavobacteriales bacterium]|nr:aminodeoxychorismate/anthranilate synthase component II [Flavobacteriales bacterium]HIA10928.1 aminodeoxychorismate/anthranilate synthase component II [Flavobacteriales bacterium]
MKILVIDNYDSFTYNLVHILESIGNVQVSVVRNDQIEIDQVAAYDKVMISPGPGLPEDAGIIEQVIKQYANSKSILGVCLGHQAIIQAFGGKLVNLNRVFHGVATDVTVSEPADHIFNGIPETFKAGRYHSWIADKDSLPDEIDVIATTEDGVIMGVKHKSHDVRGIQFHPESILTEYGRQIMNNWVQI